LTTGNKSGFLAIYICVCIFFYYLFAICLLSVPALESAKPRPSIGAGGKKDEFKNKKGKG
jgi:hypothetical protein